ncbi:MAG: DUF2339 domain-containing protein [Verrucomicrobiota bacterium]
MSNPTKSEWRSAINRLHERLEQAEIHHRMVMDELKNELSVLRERLPEIGEDVVPVTVEDLPLPEAVKWDEPGQRVQPPPLPKTPVWLPDGADPDAKDSGSSFEEKLGQVWLVRIGIVLLITGLVLGANWAYKNWIHDLPAGVRLAGLYVCSALIGGSGILLSRRENLKHYGEVLLAGGLAFFYYCTYAAHHVKRLQVIDSPVAAASCLLLAAGAIAVVSWFRKSQGTAVMGILLASYSTMIQPLDWLSSISNLLLALTGVLLMLRPGWKSPGIASLLGTYGAFTGWQLLGAAGRGSGDELATMWFLPGSWAIFAIPGMLGRFRESLGERGRAIFTAANNGLFFALFSWMWLARHGGADYWKVAAVFGGILLAMGIVGRKRSDDAAASNVMQGLGALSLALVLKLDGYHLGLALAGESLALAIAFHRFRKRAEFAFSLLAGMSAALIAFHLSGKAPDTPAWSGLLGALLVGMAAVMLRFNVERSETPAPPVVRSGTSILCYSSLAILLAGWCYRLTEAWQLAVAMALAALFAVVTVRLDRDGWLPEIGRASGITGIFSILLLFTSTPWQGNAFAIPFAVIACAAWHQSTRQRDILTPYFAWLFALIVPVVSMRMLGQWYPELSHQVLPLAVSSAGLVAIARLVGAHRLEITGSVLNVIALAMVCVDLLRADSVLSQSISFVPAAAALVTLWMIRFKRGSGTNWQGIIAASCLFIAWPAALLNAVPQHAIDLMALSAGIGFFVAMKRDEAAPVYCRGWTLVSLVAYGALLAGGPSSPLHSHRFEGFALVLLLTGIAMKRPRSWAAQPAATVDRQLSWLACIVLSVWATHITADYSGWKAVAVLWTLLGFGMVSFGLMVNRVTSRQAGFLLLSLALLKLFFIDVWDFTTFMRVISFIALGLALVVLGIFYHRFAPALKRLIDVDEPARQRDETTEAD